MVYDKLHVLVSSQCFAPYIPTASASIFFKISIRQKPFVVKSIAKIDHWEANDSFLMQNVFLVYNKITY